MKKIIAFVLVLLMTFTIVPSVLAASGPSPTTHAHKWVLTDRIEPTCTNPGAAYYYCSCGSRKVDKLPALGHVFSTKTYTGYADCTHYGKFYWTCSRCGYTSEGNDKPLGHDWSEWIVVKYPTASEDGLMERKCARCGITEQKTISGAEISESGIFIEADLVYDKEYEIGEYGSYYVKFINVSKSPLTVTGFDLLFANGSIEEHYWGIEGGTLLYPGEDYTVTTSYQMQEKDKEAPGSTEIIVNVTGKARPNDSGNDVKSNTVPLKYRLAGPDKIDLILSVNPLVGGTVTHEVSIGETVDFEYSLTNNSSVDLEINNIRYWYSENNIDNVMPFYSDDLAAGETRDSSSLGAKAIVPYVVKEEDVKDGKIKITFFAVARDYSNGTPDKPYDVAYSNDVALEFTLKNEEPALSLKAELEDTPPFYVNDTAKIRVTIKNISEEDLVVDQIYYYSTNNTVYYEDDPFGYTVFKPGEENSVTIFYTVSAYDIWHSDEDIVLTFGAYAIVPGQSDEEPPLRSNEQDLNVPWKDLPRLVISKYSLAQFTEDYACVANEQVEYKIYIKNVSPDPVYDVNIYDQPEGHEKDLICGFKIMSGNYTNEDDELIYDYVLTQDDIDNSVQLEDGKYYFRNNLYVSYHILPDLSDEEITKYDYCYIPVEKKDVPVVDIVKTETSSPGPDGHYHIDEYIYYDITVYNNLDNAINVKGIYDSEDKNTPIVSDFVIPAGAPFTVPFSCRIDEDYVLSTDTFLNQAWIVYVDPTDDTEYEHTIFSNIVKSPIGPDKETIVEGDFVYPTVKKYAENKPKNGSYYQEDEVIHYVFSITNNDEGTISDVEIFDAMKGNNEDGVIWIGDIQPNETLTGGFYHTVTHDDCIGVLYNEGKLTFISADGEDREIYPIPCTVDTENLVPIPETPNVILTKSAPFAPLYQPFYIENESIEYWLIATNCSDQPIYNLMISDDLYDPNLGLASVEYLAPWTSTETFTFTHTVTKEEAESETGTLNNQAIAFFNTDKGSTKQEKVYSNVLSLPVGVPEEPPFDSDDIYMVKEVVKGPQYEDFFTYNETIYYLITIYNNSDYPVSVSTVYDNYWGSDFSGSASLAGGVIPPHDSLPIPFTHTVTWEEAHSAGHYLKNTAHTSAIVNFGNDEQQISLSCEPVSVNIGYNQDYRIDQTPNEPILIKKVIGDPKKVYMENEDIWFTLILYNMTGYTIYDIAVYDQLVPGFYLDGISLLGDGEVYSKTFCYTVNKFDAEVMGSVTNIGWFTMLLPMYNYNVTRYTNEVTVPCGKIPDPPRTPASHPDSCKVYLVGKGEGAWQYLTMYCAEHNSVEAGFRKLLEMAETDADKLMAYRVGLDMWTKALNSEYDALIENAATENISEVLSNDKIVFSGYLKAFRNRLEYEGLSETDINDQIIGLIRDRVTELCYTFGDGKEDRKDILLDDIPEINRVEADRCSVSYDHSLTGSYTTFFNVCGSHIMLAKTIDKTLAVTQYELELKSAGWIRAKSYWQAKLTTDYDALINRPDTAGIFAMTERATFLAMVKTHGALYDAVYGDEALTEELTATLMIKRALELDAK